MPQFMTIHRAPGLLPEQWNETSAAVYAGELARFEHAYVNLGSGFIVTIYEAKNKDDLIEQFEELGLAFEEIHEVQFSQSFAQMEQLLREQGRI